MRNPGTAAGSQLAWRGPERDGKAPFFAKATLCLVGLRGRAAGAACGSVRGRAVEAPEPICKRLDTDEGLIECGLAAGILSVWELRSRNLGSGQVRLGWQGRLPERGVQAWI